MKMVISCGCLLTVCAGAVMWQALAYADRCYVRTGESLGCFEQGGSACTQVVPIGLPCPGGYWTIADASALGLDLADVCEVDYLEYQTPEEYHTLGDQDEGHLEQGAFDFWCTATRSCDKVTLLDPAYKVACNPNNPSLCTTITLYTAGGGDCPASSQ